MTDGDRVKGITVVLEDGYDFEHAKPLIEAIRCLRGVIGVEPRLVDDLHYEAKAQERDRLKTKLWEFLQGKGD